MTKPVLAQQRRGVGRVYVWPAHPPHELELISVTTVIGGGVPKDGLKYWAANETARYAVKHRESWQNLPEDDAYDLIRRSALRYTNKRADVGSAVHDVLDAYAKGEPCRPDLSPEVQGYYNAAVKFLTDHKVEILYAEPTVYSRTYGYAGSSDLLAVVDIPEVGRVPTILDYKTGKNIYDDQAIQLCAYSRGDFIADPDGVTEVPFPGEFRYGIIVRPQASGEYDHQVFELTDDLFDLFLAAKKVAARDHVTRSCKRRKLAVAA